MVASGSVKSLECPRAVLDLIERFELHRDTYKKPGYNETQVRREFIDPLFKALDWDIDNEKGHAEAYKDVIHEHAIKIGGSTKAPDYCFRFAGIHCRVQSSTLPTRVRFGLEVEMPIDMRDTNVRPTSQETNNDSADA